MMVLATSLIIATMIVRRSSEETSCMVWNMNSRNASPRHTQEDEPGGIENDVQRGVEFVLHHERLELRLVGDLLDGVDAG